MADTLYGRPQTDLYGVLTSAGTAPPVAPSQPQASSMGGGLSPEQQRLLEIIMSPDPAGPAPPPDDETVGTKLGAQIFSTLGDALSGYAAGINGTQQSQFYNTYLARREYKRSERERHGAQQAQSQAEAKRRGAEYLFRANEQNADRATNQQYRAADLAIKESEARENAALRRATLVQEKSIADAKIAQDAAELAGRIKIAEMEATSRKRSDDLQAQVRKLNLTTDGDKEQNKVATELRQGVIAAKAKTIQDLQAGTVTVQQVEEEWQDTLDAAGLTGVYRESLDAFYRAKMGPIMMRFAPQQGPEQPSSDNATDYMMQQAGQALKSGVKKVTAPFVNTPRR